MKIKSIQFGNHPILKNLIFDFSVGGNIKDITLLIGENGCGKTVFLEELYKIISGGITFWKDNVDRIITIIFSADEVTALSLPVEVITFNVRVANGVGWDKIKVFDQIGLDITNEVRPKIQDGSINGYLKCAYSTVEINFVLQDINSVKATSIDDEEKPKSKSNTNLASEIAQLLIDIRAQDAAESDKWMRENRGLTKPVPELPGKLDRFKKAYKKMFEGKALGDIRPENGLQKILFKKNNGDEFGIESLSSGEKQVVYRVGYLLRNLKTISGGLILIDEPELSLHPRWQIKYLNFLKEIFNDNGTMNIQFVIATHSPYLLKNSLATDIGVANFFYKDDNIEIENPNSDSWSLFKHGPTLGEINYYGFRLPTFEFHNELYGYIQEKYKKFSERDLEVFLGTKSISINVPWIKQESGVAQIPYNVSLMTFIRNSIHHPENTLNRAFTDTELKTSVELMIDLLKAEQNTSGNSNQNVHAQ